MGCCAFNQDYWDQEERYACAVYEVKRGIKTSAPAKGIRNKIASASGSKFLFISIVAIRFYLIVAIAELL